MDELQGWLDFPYDKLQGWLDLPYNKLQGWLEVPYIVKRCVNIICKRGVISSYIPSLSRVCNQDLSPQVREWHSFLRKSENNLPKFVTRRVCCSSAGSPHGTFQYRAEFGGFYDKSEDGTNWE